MSVVLSEHLPLLASAPDGIQKLRGLILELAVRGKLVPQNPDDEPASELLKRIAQGRAKLDGATPRKKNKQTSASKMNDWPFAIPTSWEWSRLSDLTQVLNGRAYSKDELLDAGTPVLRVGNLFTSNHWYYSNLALEPEKYCDKGDLIYSWSASFGPFIWKGPRVIYHYHIWKLSLFDEASYSKEFLYKFLLEKTAEIKASGHGVSMVHMTKEKMEKLPVPVPPLAEQHRIVAKVDELMALCDRLEAEQADAASAHAKLVETLLGTLTQSTDAADLAANWQRLAEHFDTLFTTEASIDALKQTVLQLAVMGKLVPQDPADEPARELVKRIDQERARLEAAGICKKSKPMPLVSEEELPFTLPQSWCRTRLGSLCSKITDGEHATPRRCSAGHYLLSARNVTNEGILLDDVDFVPPEEFERIRKRCDPNIGDVLISCSGSVGRVALVDRDNAYSMVRSAAMVRPISLGITPEYVARCLRSPLVQSEMVSKSRQSAQTNLFLGAISSLVIPLPPIHEQHRIVAKVDELMALCDSLKADLAESSTRHARLSATLIESVLQAA